MNFFLFEMTFFQFKFNFYFRSQQMQLKTAPSSSANRSVQASGKSMCYFLIITCSGNIENIFSLEALLNVMFLDQRDEIFIALLEKLTVLFSSSV